MSETVFKAWNLVESLTFQSFGPRPVRRVGAEGANVATYWANYFKIMRCSARVYTPKSSLNWGFRNFCNPIYKIVEIRSPLLFWMFVYRPINRLMKKGWDSNCQNSKYSWLSLSRSRKDPLKHLEISWLRHNSFEVLRKTKYHKWICTVWPEIIENCIFHNMLIPAVLVHLSYTGIIRKGCNKLFLVVIICLTSIFSVFTYSLDTGV